MVMNSRPKILFVTPHSPWAAAYGGQQRTLNIGKLLSRVGDISFVITPAEGDYEETANHKNGDFKVRRIVRPVLVSCAGNHLARLRHRIRYELDANYLATHHYTTSEADRRALQELVQEHDLVWVHTIRAANLFGIDRWPHSVLDVDDLLSRVYRAEANSGSAIIRKLLDLRLAWMWRRRERRFNRRFYVLSVCSEEDRRYLGSSEQIHVIPNGFNPQPTPTKAPLAPSAQPRIGFIGTLRYRPNEDGVRWFIREVWPLVKSRVPEAQLRLVGRDSDGPIAQMGRDVVGLGYLEDPSDEIAAWSAMIVPVRFGGGTRIKTAEAFARKCPVVATTMGAFGYDVCNGEEIFLADQAQDFASACINLLREPQLGVALSERAYRRFVERWTWDSFQGSVEAVIEDCLSRSRSLAL